MIQLSTLSAAKFEKPVNPAVAAAPHGAFALHLPQAQMADAAGTGKVLPPPGKILPDALPVVKGPAGKEAVGQDPVETVEAKTRILARDGEAAIPVSLSASVKQEAPSAPKPEPLPATKQRQPALAKEAALPSAEQEIPTAGKPEQPVVAVTASRPNKPSLPTDAGRPDAVRSSTHHKSRDGESPVAAEAGAETSLHATAEEAGVAPAKPAEEIDRTVPGKAAAIAEPMTAPVPVLQPAAATEEAQTGESEAGDAQPQLMQPKRDGKAPGNHALPAALIAGIKLPDMAAKAAAHQTAPDAPVEHQPGTVQVRLQPERSETSAPQDRSVDAKTVALKPVILPERTETGREPLARREHVAVNVRYELTGERGGARMAEQVADKAIEKQGAAEALGRPGSPASATTAFQLTSTTMTPLAGQVADMPVSTSGLNAPVGTSASAQPVRPHEFSALVDRLVEARENVRSGPVSMAVMNDDFGQVSLRFSHDNGQLSVAMSSQDPEFARAAQAAAATDASQPNDSSPQHGRREDGSQTMGNLSRGNGGAQTSNGTEQNDGRRHGAGADNASEHNGQNPEGAERDARPGMAGIFA